MLPRDYRLTAYNDSGAAVDVTVTARRWKFDSNGAVTFEGTEATLLSATSVSDATLTTGTAQTNDTDAYIGMDGVMSLANGAGTGIVTLFLEPSTDGGASWPSAQDGIPLASGVPNDGDEVAFSA